MATKSKEKARCIFINTSDPEVVLRAITKFHRNTGNHALHLGNNGVLLAQKFEELLDPDRSEMWFRAQVPHPPNLNGFLNTVDDFIAIILGTQPLTNQHAYLEKAPIPYSMTCAELEQRLISINNLTAMFPGQGFSRRSRWKPVL